MLKFLSKYCIIDLILKKDKREILFMAHNFMELMIKDVGNLYAQDDWGYVFAVVITGLVVVFLILLILVGVLWLFGKLMGGTGKKKKPSAEEAKPAVAQAASAAPVADAEDEDEADDEELIAVISAAIAAYSAADGKQYRITSVKKKEKALRSGWGAAGISENTRPF